MGDIHGSISNVIFGYRGPRYGYTVYAIDTAYHVSFDRKFSRTHGVWVPLDSLELRTLVYPYCDLPLAQQEFSARLPAQPRPLRRAWVAFLIEYALFEQTVALDDASKLFPPARKCVRHRECENLLTMTLTRKEVEPFVPYPE
jgi:hypothetical protein